MKSSCLELEALKMAREQAESKAYTPPELSAIEERINARAKVAQAGLRCTDGKRAISKVTSLCKRVHK